MKKIPLMLAAGILSAGSFAATLHVDPNGDGKSVFRTIGAAAIRAQPGDVILVRPGVYREHIAPERGGEAGGKLLFVHHRAGTGHQLDDIPDAEGTGGEVDIPHLPQLLCTCRWKA